MAEPWYNVNETVHYTSGVIKAPPHWFDPFLVLRLCIVAIKTPGDEICGLD